MTVRARIINFNYLHIHHHERCTNSAVRVHDAVARSGTEIYQIYDATEGGWGGGGVR
jgi:hypothetical protein